MILEFKVNKSVEEVFKYLTDMQKFVSVHPVIYKIQNIKDNHYLVFEKLKFGFIPFSFTYPVTIESNKINNSVRMYATVMKIVKIEMNYTLSVDYEQTLVSEHIQINTVLPVKTMMNKIFKTQHNQLFLNIG